MLDGIATIVGKTAVIVTQLILMQSLILWTQESGWMTIIETPKPEPCPHYQDNQGFCHQCGILMCEETAKMTGYFREGMKTNENLRRI